MKITPLSWDTRRITLPDVRADTRGLGINQSASVLERSSLVPPQGIAETEGQTATWQPGLYGDGQLFPVTFTAGQSILILQRPSFATRVLLVIQNDLAAGSIRINLDAQPSATVGLAVPAGGSLIQDRVVFQNDIWVFSPGNGNIQLAFMNIKQ